MHYTQLFRTLREAKGLTLEELARLSRRHRNTIVNVESGRPVKFKTLSELMLKMGYNGESPEMRSMALLWLESISGLPFSRPETESAARKAIANYRSTSRQAIKRLEDDIIRLGLTAEQISLLIFAVRHPSALTILEASRNLPSEMEANHSAAQLKVAEDK